MLRLVNINNNFKNVRYSCVNKTSQSGKYFPDFGQGSLSVNQVKMLSVRLIVFWHSIGDILFIWNLWPVLVESKPLIEFKFISNANIHRNGFRKSQL